jgi:hypothetical protein
MDYGRRNYGSPPGQQTIHMSEITDQYIWSMGINFTLDFKQPYNYEDYQAMIYLFNAPITSPYLVNQPFNGGNPDPVPVTPIPPFVPPPPTEPPIVEPPIVTPMCPASVTIDNCPANVSVNSYHQFTFTGDNNVSTFRWVMLSGRFTGGIDEITGYYRSPQGGTNCITPAIVGIKCQEKDGGEWTDVASCTFPIIPAQCSGTILIGSTILNMLVGESQGLTMIYESGEVCGAEEFSWSLTGGGSLVDNVTTAIYTAPASNVDCLNNGTVSLLCNGVVMDSVTINTTTAYAPAPIAYYKPTVTSPKPGGSSCSVLIQKEHYNCLGVGSGLEGCTTCDTGYYAACFQCYSGQFMPSHQTGCTDPTMHYIPDMSGVPCTAAVWSARCSAYGGCGVDPESAISISCETTTDVRGTAAKSAGCCPWDLN